MSKPEWKIEQPSVEDMMCPVRCLHCQRIYSLTHVHVTGRCADCSVWTTPCCGVTNVDDRPWVAERHYRKLDREDVARGYFMDHFGRMEYFR